MHRIALLFFLLIPVSALADVPDTIGQIGLLYVPAESLSLIGIYSPQLYDPLLPGGGSGVYRGTFTNVVPSLTCLNTACTKMSVDVQVSGLTLNSVEFQGHLYPVLYFSGTLDFTGTLFGNGSGTYTGETMVSGDLTACLDPSCSTQLFELDVRPNMLAQSGIGVAFNSNGKGVLEGAGFSNPEPATLLLFATGLAGIGWRKFRIIGTANL